MKYLEKYLAQSKLSTMLLLLSLLFLEVNYIKVVMSSRIIIPGLSIFISTAKPRWSEAALVPSWVL